MALAVRSAPFDVRTESSNGKYFFVIVDPTDANTPKGGQRYEVRSAEKINSAIHQLQYRSSCSSISMRQVELGDLGATP
jgi:hypothetical protein